MGKVQQAEDAVKDVITEVEQEADKLSAADVAFSTKIEYAVEHWVGTHLRNTPFSQDTAAWNVLQNALRHLAPAIAERLK